MGCHRFLGVAQIQDAVADGHADSARHTAMEHSERQILEGEIGFRPIGGFNPAKLVAQKGKWFQVTRSRS